MPEMLKVLFATCDGKTVERKGMPMVNTHTQNNEIVVVKCFIKEKKRKKNGIKTVVVFEINN